MIFNSEKRKLQQGSIMLEVIAVLALMGVMGAMLFRQIYQRNQELHNIQMASEIRTVKEAFSSYIQANRASILTECRDDIPPVGSDKVWSCDVADLQAHIKEYLPDGWFDDDDDDDDDDAKVGSALAKSYELSMYVYRQADDSAEIKIYGVAFPTVNTIPSTGWNFKRAARVALLIGADGGVYGEGITKDEGGDPVIAGTLGTWHLDVLSGMNKADYNGAVYVAITGLDNFTPEFETAQAKVTLQKQWDIQAHKLNAYSQLSVGDENTGCFKDEYIKHNTADVQASGESVVYSDTVVAPGDGCFPTFWVKADPSGEVYVRNDLNVGMDSATGTPAIALTKEGVIQQKDGLVIDEKGRLVSQKLGTDVGDLSQDERYVVDPAYTSTMNDIRLTSRGGAKLSEILPKYILQEMSEIENSGTVNIPVCPTNYKAALVITPVSWKSKLTRGGSENMDNFPVSGTVDASSTSRTESISNGKADLSDLIMHVPCVRIGAASTGIVKDATPNAVGGTNKWNFTLGYFDNTSCNASADVKAIAQSYCVFDTSTISSEERYKNSTDCGNAYLKWDSTSTPNRCTSEYDTAKIGGMDTSTDENTQKKKTMCRISGGTWNASGKTCTWS